MVPLVGMVNIPPVLRYTCSGGGDTTTTDNLILKKIVGSEMYKDTVLVLRKNTGKSTGNSGYGMYQITSVPVS